MDMKKVDYLVDIMMGMSICAIIMRILLSSVIRPATLSVVSYSLIGIAIFTVMFIPAALKSEMKTLDEFNSIRFIFDMLKNNTPFFLLIALLSWLVAINLTYSEQINLGNQPGEYNSLSLASAIFIILQIYATFDFLKASMKQSRSNTPVYVSKKYTTYVFALFNIAIIGSINIILEFFSTDG